MEYLEIVLWGAVSLVFIIPFIFGLKDLWGRLTQKKEDLEIADSIMTIYTYRNPDSQTIVITNADDSPVPKDAEPFLKDAIFKKAGYEPHVQTFEFVATRDASTTLEPVAVEVEAPKKELPYEPNEYVAKMQGKALDKLNEPFEPHPEINA
jgi:hypothetical protein